MKTPLTNNEEMKIDSRIHLNSYYY